MAPRHSAAVCSVRCAHQPHDAITSAVLRRVHCRCSTIMTGVKRQALRARLGARAVFSATGLRLAWPPVCATHPSCVWAPFVGLTNTRVRTRTGARVSLARTRARQPTASQTRASSRQWIAEDCDWLSRVKREHAASADGIRAVGEMTHETDITAAGKTGAAEMASQ